MIGPAPVAPGSNPFQTTRVGTDVAPLVPPTDQLSPGAPVPVLAPGAANAPTATSSIPVEPASQVWLHVLAPSQTYSVAMDPLGIAQPGDRYSIRQINAGWALVVSELGPPDWEEWMQIDDNVEIIGS